MLSLNHFIFWHFIIYSIFFHAHYHTYTLCSPLPFRARNTSESEEVTLSVLQSRIGNKVGCSIALCVARSNGSTLFLKLEKTDNVLANDNTPVWHARGSPNLSHVEYERFDQEMKKVGTFIQYQDYATKSAIILFPRQNILQGYVNHKYVLKRLPLKNLTSTASSGDFRWKRSNDNLIDAEEDQNCYLEKFQNAIKSGTYILIEKQVNQFPPISNPKVNVRNKRETQNRKIAYPEILVTVDADSSRSSMSESSETINVIIDVLCFWNMVELLYTPIPAPRLKINIAGIIICLDDYATPYLKSSEVPPSGNFLENLAWHRAKVHFFKERKNFPLHLYDYIFVMTMKIFCIDFNTCFNGGISTIGPNCIHKGTAFTSNYGTISTVALVFHSGFHEYVIAAHELGHMFSADHDDEKINATSIMLPACGDAYQWSQYSLNNFSSFFSSERSNCLYNKPRTLPGSTTNIVPPSTFALLSSSSIPQWPQIECLQHFPQLTQMAPTDENICSTFIQCDITLGKMGRIEASDGVVCNKNSAAVVNKICRNRTCVDLPDEQIYSYN